MSERSDAELNEDAVWQALTNSKQLRDLLEKVAQDIAQEAGSIARVVAYDEGYLASSYKGTVGSAKAARRKSSEGYAWSSRRRRGQRGTNRYLDYMVKDTPGTQYQGQVGVAYTAEYKARLVEYGTIFKGPRRIFLEAAQKIADKYGLELEIGYDRTNQADPSRVAELNRARGEKAAGVPKSGEGAQ